MSQSFYPVHLVGSVPLVDAASVFEMVGEILNGCISRIPDGETGERSNWIAWQLPLLKLNPALEPDRSKAAPTHETASDGAAVDASDFRFLKVKTGIDQAEIKLETEYAKQAIASFEAFAEIRAGGKIPADVRFQVSLPTPYAIASLYISPDSWPQFLPAYERAIRRDLAQIAARIPHEMLAIQWDVCMEVMAWEGQLPSPEPDLAGFTFRSIGALCDAVPADVEVGLHLCYGDPGHKHIVEPKNSEILVALANGISASTDRVLNWIHMPVPRERVDDDYYAALGNLALDSECTLFLGLVHFTDSDHGASARIASARKVVTEFGIATECGFGRRPADTVAPLLELHRRCSKLAATSAEEGR